MSTVHGLMFCPQHDLCAYCITFVCIFILHFWVILISFLYIYSYHCQVLHILYYILLCRQFFLHSLSIYILQYLFCRYAQLNITHRGYLWLSFFIFKTYFTTCQNTPGSPWLSLIHFHLAELKDLSIFVTEIVINGPFTNQQSKGKGSRLWDCKLRSGI